jgi:phage-related minor tail protein
VLNEIKASSKDYVEALATMLEKTDETMRTFTEVLVQSGVEAATRTDRLSQALPAIEARAQTLAAAAERISAIVADLHARQPRPQPETVD